MLLNSLINVTLSFQNQQSELKNTHNILHSGEKKDKSKLGKHFIIKIKMNMKWLKKKQVINFNKLVK